MAKQVYNDDMFLVVLLMVQFIVLFIWGLILFSAFKDIGRVLKTKKIKLLFHIIGFSALAYWSAGVYTLVQESTVDQSFDPYKILGLGYGETSKSVIKKSYFKLQLLHHPDKTETPEESAEFFPKLVMAYETLTEDEKMNNWKNFGHPDGSKVQQAVQLALPSFLMNKDYQVYSLTGLFVFFVFGPLWFLSYK